MNDEEYRRNVGYFLRAAGWILTEQTEVDGFERWRALHIDSGTIFTSGDLEYLTERALRTLREKYLEARRAAPMNVP